MAAPPKVVAATKKFNPYALKVSARVPPWSTLHHVGRKSGREYVTPVIAFAARAPIDAATVARAGAPVSIAEHRDVLVVHPLPWGSDVDWCRNIRAAGSYRLTRKGVEYRVDELRILTAEEAQPLLNTVLRATSGPLDLDEFLVGRLRKLSRG